MVIAQVDSLLNKPRFHSLSVKALLPAAETKQAHTCTVPRLCMSMGEEISLNSLSV